MSAIYVDEILKKIQTKAKELDAELSSKEVQVLTGRLKFLWEPGKSGTTDVTKWRHRRSRQVYEQVQDTDSHLFLAVVLSVNPTECGQTKFQPVANYLRHLGRYETYCFTPRESVSKALHGLAGNHDIANNKRYCRLMENLFHGQYYSNVTSLC